MPWDVERVRSSRRFIRYGAPVAAVVVGVLFAAFETNSLGNTVSLVLIAGGLIWLMTALGREMGMTADTGRAPRVPELPPEEGERAEENAAPDARPADNAALDSRTENGAAADERDR